MKHVTLFITLALVLVSCGTRKGYFSIEGRFLNLNQGEFYVYSTDGTINGIDTIKVNAGRFALEIPCRKEGTLMLVFPNFSEQPIFAEPGKGVDIKADASHLKQMEVTGTDDNELMTDFRKGTALSSPPEQKQRAEHFIKDNASSPVAVYLLRKYFMSSNNTEDLKKARLLISLLAKEQQHNGGVIRMQNELKIMTSTPVGSKIRPFSTFDVNGKLVTNALFSGKTSIIFTWSSWSYDSENMARRINNLMQQSGGKVAALAISLDGSKKECKTTIERDALDFPTVCDEKLFDGQLIKTFGLHAVPDNIIISPDGKVIAKGVAIDDLERYLTK